MMDVPRVLVNLDHHMDTVEEAYHNFLHLVEISCWLLLNLTIVSVNLDLILLMKVSLSFEPFNSISYWLSDVFPVIN